MTKADQDMLLELARKFIRAWDPDYTKLTPRAAENGISLSRTLQDALADRLRIDR